MGKISNVKFTYIMAIVMVAFVSIGFIYVSSNADTVNAGIQKSWNVGLNTEDYTEAGNGINVSNPVITKNKIKLDVEFENPGDYKTYVFEVLNEGDINAVLKSIDVKAGTNNSKDVSLSYVVYKGNDVITSSADPKLNEQYNHLYRTYGKNIIEITIQYNQYEEQLTQTITTANYDLSLSYTQVD